MLQVRIEILSSRNFLSSLHMVTYTAFLDRVGAINAHVDLLPDPGEFEDFVDEHTAQFKAKANKNKIKIHIINPINALIKRFKNGHSAKRLIDRTKNPISELEMKIEEIKRDLEDTFDSKVEEAIDNLFENGESFASKV